MFLHAHCRFTRCDFRRNLFRLKMYKTFYAITTLTRKIKIKRRFSPTVLPVLFTAPISSITQYNHQHFQSTIQIQFLLVYEIQKSIYPHRTIRSKILNMLSMPKACLTSYFLERNGCTREFQNVEQSVARKSTGVLASVIFSTKICSHTSIQLPLLSVGLQVLGITRNQMLRILMCNVLNGTQRAMGSCEKQLAKRFN